MTADANPQGRASSRCKSAEAWPLLGGHQVVVRLSMCSSFCILARRCQRRRPPARQTPPGARPGYVLNDVSDFGPHSNRGFDDISIDGAVSRLQILNLAPPMLPSANRSKHSAHPAGIVSDALLLPAVIPVSSLSRHGARTAVYDGAKCGYVHASVARAHRATPIHHLVAFSR